MPIKHKKTNSVPAWTQTDLDKAIAAGTVPAGTTLSGFVLSTDWNDDHTAPAISDVTGLQTALDGKASTNMGLASQVIFNKAGALDGADGLTYDSVNNATTASPVLIGSSGIQYGLSLQVNAAAQTGTAGYKAFGIDITDTGRTANGAAYPFYITKNGSYIFQIDQYGSMQGTNAMQATGFYPSGSYVYNGLYNPGGLTSGIASNGLAALVFGTSAQATFKSTHTAAVAIGANGATNPALQVDTSAANSATGIEITANAAAAGVRIDAISSGTNEAMTIASKGTGTLNLASGNTSAAVQIQPGGSTSLSVGRVQSGFTFAASTTAALVRWRVTAAADTSLTTTAEATHSYFDLSATRQHATGAIALTRDFRITGSNHSAVGASTFTDVAAFSVDLSTGTSANATITNIHNVYIPSTALTGTKTNSYGLTVNANTGATNNYAAQFVGGACFMGDLAADPAATPTGGGFFYAKAGALYWKGSSGTVTLIAPA